MCSSLIRLTSRNITMPVVSSSRNATGVYSSGIYDSSSGCCRTATSRCTVPTPPADQHALPWHNHVCFLPRYPRVRTSIAGLDFGYVPPCVTIGPSARDGLCGYCRNQFGTLYNKTHTIVRTSMNPLIGFATPTFTE